MSQILLIEIICYFGIIVLLPILAVRGILTEQLFALLQVAPLTLILITALLNYSSPGYPFGLLAGSVGTIVFTIIGYPIARWLYRQLFPRK